MTRPPLFPLQVLGVICLMYVLVYVSVWGEKDVYDCENYDPVQTEECDRCDMSTDQQCTPTVPPPQSPIPQKPSMFEVQIKLRSRETGRGYLNSSTN